MYVRLRRSLMSSTMFSKIHNPQSLAKMLNKTEANNIYPVFEKAIPEVIESAPCAGILDSVSKIFNRPLFKLIEDSIIVACGETGAGKNVALKRAIKDRKGVLMVYFREPLFKNQFPFLLHDADTFLRRFFRRVFFLEDDVGISELSFDDVLLFFLLCFDVL
eukprot:TRINITY_DN6830_c0_g1_i3.p1 TRINITY_DN6830_c0_g1~~TRINITY_DN6830_c0_g1_i3.p1  ORF type:complete len:162 (+),score=20.08 TRINITY_DN6830_c0_g1_i3:160-645(+)